MQMFSEAWKPIKRYPNATPGEEPVVPGGRKLLYFLDGTWLNIMKDKRPNSNVALAFLKLKRVWPADGRHVLRYVPGSGKYTGCWPYRVAASLFGVDLDTMLADVYRDLCQTYRPGDQIYLFGYSRGAYLARTLTGLIRNCGILNAKVPPDKLEENVNEAIKHYRNRTQNADFEKALEFRVRNAVATCLNDEERNYRCRVIGEGDQEIVQHEDLRINYVGVFDTVGQLGLPANLDRGGRLDRRFEFHDRDLSRIVKRARQAVAADEIRGHLPPTLWDNLPKLNCITTSKNCAAQANEDPHTLPFQQAWFPGNHGVVGGQTNTVRSGLSDLSLHWILEGAKQAGLDIPQRVFDDLTQSAANKDQFLTTTNQPQSNNVRFDHDIASFLADGPYLRHGWVKRGNQPGSDFKLDKVHCCFDRCHTEHPGQACSQPLCDRDLYFYPWVYSDIHTSKVFDDRIESGDYHPRACVRRSVRPPNEDTLV